MSDVTMEKRLRLVKQIRSRYNEDLHDLSDREMILYGRSSRTAENDGAYEQDIPREGQISFFRVRLVIAVILFLTVILMDSNGTAVAGITAEEIFRAISADYEEVLESFNFERPEADSGAKDVPLATGLPPQDA